MVIKTDACCSSCGNKLQKFRDYRSLVVCTKSGCLKHAKPFSMAVDDQVACGLIKKRGASRVQTDVDVQ